MERTQVRESTSTSAQEDLCEQTDAIAPTSTVAFASENTDSPKYDRRVIHEYDLHQQRIMNLRKQNILNELEILQLSGKSCIFENQDMIASLVVTAFKNRKIVNVMVLSKTQSGKTGSMCATIKRYLEDSSNLIPIEHIYIITGLSSCEWKDQTKERMPESIQARVYHRCELPSTFVEEIKHKQNILIIMDEIQVAAKHGQTIYNTFQRADLLNMNRLYENDIKILEYTATPDGTIYDLMKWRDGSTKILAEVGDRYVSSYDLLKYGRFVPNEHVIVLGEDDNTCICGRNIRDTEHTHSHRIGKIVKMHEDTDTYDILLNGALLENVASSQLRLQNIASAMRHAILHLPKRVKQYKDLCGYDKHTQRVDESVYGNIREVKSDIDAFPRPLYHIIRTRTKGGQDVTVDNFKHVFGTNDYKYISYDIESEVDDINRWLTAVPTKHTFIFIKEMLRCAKTLCKTHIGILYDRYTPNPDDTTIIQGLIGRDTGYDNNGISICYTNIESINKYEMLWISGFEDKTVKWNSKTTKFIDGVLHGKNTFNDPSKYSGSNVVESDDTSVLSEPTIMKFSRFEDAKKYYTEALMPIYGGRGPNRRTPEESGPYAGYYLSTIGKGDNRTRVRNTAEIYEVRRWNLDETHHYTIHPCYEDIRDKNTLQWWMIHY